MLLKIAQTFNEQASTGMFVPGFMATYCHAKPLLAAPKAQKALPTVRTSENMRTLELIRDSGDDKQLAAESATRHHYKYSERPFVGLNWSDETSKALF